MASFEIKLLSLDEGRGGEVQKESFPLREIYLLMTVSSKLTLGSPEIFFSSSPLVFVHLFFFPSFLFFLFHFIPVFGNIESGEDRLEII